MQVKTPSVTGAFFILLLQACAGTPPVINTQSLASTADLADTPFYPQQAYQCGPAALATVVDHAGVEVSPETVQPFVYLPGREGSLQAEMLATPARFGLLGVQVKPSMQALLELVSAGYPVLVLQNLAFETRPVWHYAVVIGYDLEKQQIILRSGVEPRVLYSLRGFDRTWEDSGRWAMAVLAPGEIPAGLAPMDYLQAASALERLQHFQPARQSYVAATDRWPDNALAWAGVGNSAFALGEPAAAESAYRRALALDAGNVLLMNNLAAVLGEQGCRDVALSVINCALGQQSKHPVLEVTAEEIRRSTAGPNDCRSFSCPGSSH